MLDKSAIAVLAYDSSRRCGVGKTAYCCEATSAMGTIERTQTFPKKSGNSASNNDKVQYPTTPGQPGVLFCLEKKCLQLLRKCGIQPAPTAYGAAFGSPKAFPHDADRRATRHTGCYRDPHSIHFPYRCPPRAA